MRTLGIVGGIGPESTIEYYRQLIAGFRERTASDSYPSLIIDSLDVNHLLSLAAKPDRRHLTEYVLESVFRLARAGAEFALLAANTPHIVFDELSAKSPIPLVSIVEATCNAAKKLGLKRLGLFGTRFAVQAGFYQQTFTKADMAVIAPNLEEQNYIHDKYVQELVNGIVLPETCAHLLDIVEAMKNRERIDALILGGTELPLILRDGGQGIPFLDTTKIHVSAALDRLLAD